MSPKLKIILNNSWNSIKPFSTKKKALGSEWAFYQIQAYASLHLMWAPYSSKFLVRVLLYTSKILSLGS
jgi:hypothetical protein